MTMKRVFFFLPALALGCAAETGAPDPEANMVHRTVVTLHADGHETVVQGFVPRAESIAVGGASGVTPSTSSISQDLACRPDSLWVYSDVNRGGAEICFQGTGTASLWTYKYPVWDRVNARYVPAPWKGAVRSYYAGTSAGGFYDSTCTGWLCTEERFAANSPPTNAGATARSADTLCVGSSC